MILKENTEELQDTPMLVFNNIEKMLIGKWLGVLSNITNEKKSKYKISDKKDLLLNDDEVVLNCYFYNNNSCAKIVLKKDIEDNKQIVFSHGNTSKTYEYLKSSNGALTLKLIDESIHNTEVK